MANSIADAFNNLNQVYMAGLMTTPIVGIELLLMSSMYNDRRLNLILTAFSIAAGLVSFALIRQQTLISDQQSSDR